jgi:hypothetical protein
MIKKLGSLLSRMTFEFIPVFIGVILALYFSNLKEEQDSINFVEKLKVSILAVIDGNIEDIDTSIIGEVNAMDTLLFYADNDTMSIFNILSKTGVISFPSLEFSTWEIIQSSGNAFVLDTHVLKEMVSMDIMINKHHIRSVNNLTEFFLNNIYKKDREAKMTLYLMIGNHANMEISIGDDLKALKELIIK